MIKDLLNQINTIKAEIAEYHKDIRSKLETDQDYVAFKQDLNDTREVYYSYKKKLISENSKLDAIDKKIQDKRNELKLLKQSLNSKVMLVEKDSGEQLQLPFNI